MNVARQRKMEARDRRREYVNKDNITVEKTIKLPSPSGFKKEGTISVKSEVKNVIDRKHESPVVAGIVKRGPGRPPKAISEKISPTKKVSKTATGLKTPTGKKGKK